MPSTKRLILALCGHKPPAEISISAAFPASSSAHSGWPRAMAMIHLVFAAQIKAVLSKVRLDVIVGCNRDIFARSPCSTNSSPSPWAAIGQLQYL